MSAGEVPAVPDTDAGREAEAWFSERSIADSLSPRYLTHDALKHAAAIVRAWLARDVPAPAGRDLTAQDVAYAARRIRQGWSSPSWVAEDLNGIARPSGGVVQPDTADLCQTIRDYLDENDLGDELLVRLGTSGHLAAGSVSPDDAPTTEPDGEDDGVLHWLCHREDLDVSMDNTSPRTHPPRITVGSIELDVRVATRLRDALTAALAAAERVEDR